MTLPVSSYEELLERVRNLTTETIQLNQEIAMSLCDSLDKEISSLQGEENNENCSSSLEGKFFFDQSQISFDVGSRNPAARTEDLHRLNLTEDSLSVFKETESYFKSKALDEKNALELLATKSNCCSSNKSKQNLGLWHSSPSHMSTPQNFLESFSDYEDLSTTLSSGLNLSEGSFSNLSQSARMYNHQKLGVKVEMVYNLLSMLGTSNREDMSKTFLAMSSSIESCHAMRQSGCIPLLIQLIHSSELDAEVKSRAAKALHNIVHAQTDEKRRRREIKVLKLLEQTREFSEVLRRELLNSANAKKNDLPEHPVAATGALMKFSFDAEHRQAICILGGLQALMELMQVDQEVHDCLGYNDSCLTMRRYAGMSLTNLTFGDGKNKALLCSSPRFLRALVNQLKSPNEDLRQVTASVLRNLSWRADPESKKTLRDVGVIGSLVIAAMEAKKEATLKSVLSALWNLSAHCSTNKVEICSVPGALGFLVKMLKYNSTSNTLSIVENAGGILRNISSQIALHEDFRQILRENNCFEILLEQLRSSSLTIVSNACGMLWNLSARCPEDQKKLWEMGATTMLRNLVQSKHKMISMGSSAALKNLLSANPNEIFNSHLDSTAKSLGYRNLPILTARKQRALKKEIDEALTETCDDIEAIGSPNRICITQNEKAEFKRFDCPRSESKESIKSSKSDSICERLNQNTESFQGKCSAMHESLNERRTVQKASDQKFIGRCNNSMIPMPIFDQKSNEEKPIKFSTGFNLKSDCQKEEKSKFKHRIPILKSRKKNCAPQVSDDCFDIEKTPVAKTTVLIESETNETNMKSRNSKATCITERISHCDIDYKYCHKSGFDKFSLPAAINMDGESSNLILVGKNDSCLDDEEKKTNITIQECHPVKNSCSKPFFSEAKPEQKDIGNKKTSDNADKTVECKSVLSSSAEISLCSPNINSKLFGFGDPLQSAQINTESSISDFRINKTSNCKIQNELKSNGIISHEKKENQVGKMEEKIIFQALNDDKKNSNNCIKINEKLHEFNRDDVIRNVNNPENKFLPNSEVETRINLDIDDKVKDPSEPFPKFKIGSEIVNLNWIQSEANKICQAIQEYQDVETNSQMSAVSCSSFLDIGEYSIFDFTNESDDFEQGESNQTSKTDELFVCSSIKSAAPNLNDYVSLPSLESSKVEPIDSFDLESSMVSVASLVSEVAENNSNTENLDTENLVTPKCQDGFQGSNQECTCSKKCASFFSEEREVLDDDNSITSQDNLPLDPELFKDISFSEVKKNLTPKEKRRLARDRYKTYTIRDFRSHQLSNFNKDRGQISKEFPEKYKGLAPETKLLIDIDQAECKLINSKSLNDLIKIGPTERKELVDNAKLVALSLKTAVEGNESEKSISLNSNEEFSRKSSIVDTATYIKEKRRLIRPACEKVMWKEKTEKNNAVESDILSTEEKVNCEVIKNPPENIDKKNPLRSFGNDTGISGSSSPKLFHKAIHCNNYNFNVTKSLPNVSKSIYSFEREETYVRNKSNLETKTVTNTPSNYFSSKNIEPKALFFQNRDFQIREKLNFRRSKPVAGLQRESKFTTERKNDRIKMLNKSYSLGTTTQNKHLVISKTSKNDAEGDNNININNNNHKNSAFKVFKHHFDDKSSSVKDAIPQKRKWCRKQPSFEKEIAQKS